MDWRQRNTDRLAGLIPAFARKVNALLDDMEAHGHPMLIIEGYRSPQRQRALYAKGRTAPGPRVTNARAGRSWHNHRLAADLVWVKPGGRGVTWSGPWPLYGQRARKQGLVWGGSFRGLVDSPHVEWHPGITLHDAGADTPKWREFVAWYSDLRNAVAPTDMNDAVKIIVNDTLAAEGTNRHGRIYAPIAPIIAAIAEALSVGAQVSWNGEQHKLYIYVKGADGDCRRPYDNLQRGVVA